MQHPHACIYTWHRSFFHPTSRLGVGIILIAHYIQYIRHTGRRTHTENANVGHAQAYLDENTNIPMLSSEDLCIRNCVQVILGLFSMKDASNMPALLHLHASLAADNIKRIMHVIKHALPLVKV